MELFKVDSVDDHGATMTAEEEEEEVPQFCRESTMLSNMSLPLQENSNLPNQRPTKGNFEKGLVDVNSEDTFLRFSR